MWRALIIAIALALTAAGCVHKTTSTRMLSDEAHAPDNSHRALTQTPFARAFGRSEIKSDPDDYWH